MVDFQIWRGIAKKACYSPFNRVRFEIQTQYLELPKSKFDDAYINRYMCHILKKYNIKSKIDDAFRRVTLLILFYSLLILFWLFYCISAKSTCVTKNILKIHTK